jgi:hypothetical protein
MSAPWKTKVRIAADTKYRRGERLQRPTFEADLQVDIDWSGLAQVLAARAADNKSGKSAMLGGLIKAKLVGRAPQWQAADAAHVD